jgi:hypothetical protein
MKHDRTLHPERGTRHPARRQEWLVSSVGNRHVRRRLRRFAATVAAIRLVTKKH